MALVDLHYAYVTFLDSRNEQSTVRVRVTSGEANEYFTAVTQILKDATDIGQLLLSIEDLSAGVMLKKGVSLETIEDTAVAPAVESHIYHFDKIGVTYKSGIAPASQFTIPARDNAQITVADDGVTILTEDGVGDPQVVAFITRLEAVMRHPTTGGTVNVLGMKVVS